VKNRPFLWDGQFELIENDGLDQKREARSAIARWFYITREIKKGWRSGWKSSTRSIILNAGEHGHQGATEEQRTTAQPHCPEKENDFQGDQKRRGGTSQAPMRDISEKWRYCWHPAAVSKWAGSKRTGAASGELPGQ
jgi:hypothetical protein